MPEVTCGSPGPAARQKAPTGALRAESCEKSPGCPRYACASRCALAACGDAAAHALYFHLPRPARRAWSVPGAAVRRVSLWRSVRCCPSTRRGGVRGRAAILWRRRWRLVVGEAASRPPPRAEQARRGPARRHVLLLGVGAGEEAVGAEQLPAERADALAVAHPPPQARRAHRLRLAPGAPQRYAGRPATGRGPGGLCPSAAAFPLPGPPPRARAACRRNAGSPALLAAP